MNVLSEASQRVLKVVQESGLVRGFELQRLAKLDSSAEFKEAVSPLVKYNLIAASGALDEDVIDRTQFAPLPSARASLYGSSSGIPLQ